MKNPLLTLLYVAMAWTLVSPWAQAQNEARWIRNPRISPDGSQIAFGYKGDLYLVPVGGGTAHPLTVHEAHDMMPVWSRDGRSIAFASDRHGNFDVFVMPVSGGQPVRLTHHSAADYPQDFSPDSKSVYFTSARCVSKENIRFYSPRLFQNLYTVPATGGRSLLISEAGMSSARLNQDGSLLVFQDRKGYEDLLRKHHRSSVTRDIWTLDLKKGVYTQVSGFDGEDLDPVFEGSGGDLLYLSEKSGTLNVVRQSAGKETPLTRFKTHPVRHLSVSQSRTLCYTYNGDLYVQPNGEQGRQVKVTIRHDGRGNAVKNMAVNTGVTQFALSPNGKEIAFVSRGEIFVTSVEGTQTKRITNTPSQERSVQWHPEGRRLIYATERGDSWDIYTAEIVRKEEPYFYASTLIEEKALVATPAEEFGPKYAPNGKSVAYVSDRNILKVWDIAKKSSKTLLPEGRNYSYSDGDWDFAWSPDSRFLLVDDGEGAWFSNSVALINAETGTNVHPLPSGYGQYRVKWVMGGKAMAWLNSKNGRKSQAYQGSREMDLYAGFWEQSSYDRYSLSKEDFALVEEQEKKEQEKKDKDKKDDKGNKDEKSSKAGTDSSKAGTDSSSSALNPITDRLKERVRRITIHSSSIGDYVFNKDGSKVYYLAAFEKGYDLWVTEPRTRDTKILAKLGAGGGGLEISKDGKSLFTLKEGRLTKIDENGKSEPIGIAGEMELDAESERAYILDHAYRQVIQKFYDPQIHGIDWKGFYANYREFLPHLNNNYDFQELLSEFLGELNASHTGGRYSPSNPQGDETASLGLLYDERFPGPGLKVTEVLAEGPFSKAISAMKAGAIIEKLDGVTIDDNTDWTALLNRKVRKNTLVTFRNNQETKSIEEVVKPISLGEETGLMYARWVQRMKDEVNRLSGGTLGYVHVQGMNDGSFRDVFDEVLGENFDRKALVVDTRFNGGGWLHDDLKTFLSGERYLDFAPQGNRLKDGEPMGRWTKPSCVLMSEGNYSDAFIFPYVYKQAGIGKTIGKPVPGTGTAVWWETQIDPTMVFGIPMVATIGRENRPTENLQLEPDINADLPYRDFLEGRDSQLAKAVEVLMLEVKGRK
jgi:Tol biopolymer transport system component/C-terminal processing protease CtpA/Prc